MRRKDDSLRNRQRWRGTIPGVGAIFAQLAVKLVLARAVLLIESLGRALWPLAVLAGLFAALVLFDLLPQLPIWLHVLVLLALLGAAGWLLWRGIGRTVLPREEAARRRLERASGLAHRPLESLEDQLAAGRESRAITGLWELHRLRILAQIQALKIGWPNLALTRHDPYALRHAVTLVLFVAVAYGGADWQGRLARALVPELPPSDERPATLDAWINPPAYTKLPPLFLRADATEVLEVPVGSVLLAQVQGGKPPWAEIGKGRHLFEVFAKDAYKLEQTIDIGDVLAVRHDEGTLGEWRIELLPDLAPTVVFPESPGRSERLALRLPYQADDDYGLVSLGAILKRADKPDLDPLELEIILPARTGKDAQGASFHDLTPHPWAGLAVDIEMVVLDAIGQEGRSDIVRVVLPERVFNHPVARALVEQRRQLSIAPENRLPVVQALGAISEHPEHFFHDSAVALSIYAATRRLMLDESAEAVPAVQRLLWDTALRIEEGELAIAERDLREIQQALMEALSEGAESSEIDSLLDQLQTALDSFLEALSDKLREDLAEGQEVDPSQGQTIDSEDLRQMIERARELAQSGNQEDAQELLAQLQQMLENLKAQPFAQGESSEEVQQAQKMMRDLEDMMSQQRSLLDRNFERQRERRKGASGDRKKSDRNESDRDAGSQESLRRQLGELMRQMGQLMDDIPGPLGQSEQQMRDARDSLRAGQSGDAIEPQKRSLEYLQQGMDSMAERFMEMFGQQGRGSGNLANRPGQGPGRDPLGRGTGDGRREATEGVLVPQEMEIRRSREILDELRRRRGDRQRPLEELDYIDRLLRQF